MSSLRSWLPKAFASAIIAWISFCSASSFSFSFSSYIKRFVLNSCAFNNLIYSSLSSISSFRLTNSLSLSLIDCHAASRSFSRPVTRLFEVSSLLSTSALTDFRSLIYELDTCLKSSKSCLASLVPLTRFLSLAMLFLNHLILSLGHEHVLPLSVRFQRLPWPYSILLWALRSWTARPSYSKTPARLFTTTSIYLRSGVSVSTPALIPSAIASCSPGTSFCYSRIFTRAFLLYARLFWL